MSLSDIASLVTSLASLVAAGLAVYGVNSWRREHVGRRKIEFAESTLECFYAASAAIRDIRHGASQGGEGASRLRQEGESDVETKLRNKAYVPLERLKAYQETFDCLRSMQYRAMAGVD